MNRFSKSVFAAAVCLAVCATVSAATVSVGIKAGGGFGGVWMANTTASSDPFVNSGLAVQFGDVVTISATGSICLSGAPLCNGPNGQFINSPPHFTALGSDYFGAVIGAIVADDTGSFQAYDATDVAKGILASSVFFIGSNLTFTAQQAGKIYLGVADSDFSDNGGPGFRVTLSSTSPNAVPEPTPLALLAIAALAAGLVRRRAA